MTIEYGSRCCVCSSISTRHTGRAYCMKWQNTSMQIVVANVRWSFWVLLPCTCSSTLARVRKGSARQKSPVLYVLYTLLESLSTLDKQSGYTLSKKCYVPASFASPDSLWVFREEMPHFFRNRWIWDFHAQSVAGRYEALTKLAKIKSYAISLPFIFIMSYVISFFALQAL